MGFGISNSRYFSLKVLGVRLWSRVQVVRFRVKVELRDSEQKNWGQGLGRIEGFRVTARQENTELCGAHSKGFRGSGTRMTGANAQGVGCVRFSASMNFKIKCSL